MKYISIVVENGAVTEIKTNEKDPTIRIIVIDKDNYEVDGDSGDTFEESLEKHDNYKGYYYG